MIFFCCSLEFTYATLPRTQRGQPIVLGGDPKGKNFLYCNGNSVIIRNIEVRKRKIVEQQIETICHSHTFYL